MLRQFSETGIDARKVRDHVLTFDRQSVLVLLVSYRDTDNLRSRQSPRTQKAPNVVKQELCAEDMARFDRIRAWRNARGHREAKPPYVLLTGRHLAEIA